MQGFEEVLEGSGTLLGRFLEGFESLLGRFSRYCGIFLRYSLHNGFLYAFEMVLDGF